MRIASASSLRGTGRGLVAGLVLLVIASLARAGESSLSITSDPGDFIGLGQDHFLTTADGAFTANGSPSYLLVSFSPNVGFDSWALLFAAPPGQALAVGPFFDATSSQGAVTDLPTLVVSGNSHGCASHGAFLVKRLEFGAGGSLAAFWVTFEQRCDGSSAMLRGELRINVDTEVALTAPIEVRVEKGLPVVLGIEATDRAGGAVTLEAADLPQGADFTDGDDGTGRMTWRTPFTGTSEHDVVFTARSDAGQDQATTRIAVTGITSIFLDGVPLTPVTPSPQVLLTPAEGDFGAALHDGIATVRCEARPPVFGTEIALGAPEGSTLTPGLYLDATPDRQSGHPFLNFACAGGPASFEVIEARFTPWGEVLALHATFESRCADGSRPLRGEVRYMADVPFLLRAPARVVATEEQETVFPVRAFDVSGDLPTLAAAPLPPGATFVDHGDSTGGFRWSPVHGQAGLHPVTFTASGNGRQDIVPAVFDVRLRNDDFDDAIAIAALPFNDAFDAAPATVAEDDPLCGSPDPSGNVWYRLTTPADATVELSTFGTSGPVKLGVYEGVRGALTEVACDSDRLTLPARAGATYFVLVRPLGRLSVRFSASLPPAAPANDDFDDAVVIGALPFTAEVRTDAATSAPDDPVCAAAGKTIWYAWTAPDDLWVKVDVAASEYPTSVSVWAGVRSALSPVVCSGSSAGFRASRGATYYVMLGAVEDVIGGHVVLAITSAPLYRIDLALDGAGAAAPSSGVATISGTVTCSETGFVHVIGSVGVRSGPATAAAHFGTWVECTGTTRFSAALGDAGTPLRAGWVDVQATATGYAPASGQTAFGSVNARILLTGGRSAAYR